MCSVCLEILLLAWVFTVIRVGGEEFESEVGLDIKTQLLISCPSFSVLVLCPWSKAVLGARIWEEGKGLCTDIFENLAVMELDLEPPSHLDYALGIVPPILHTGSLKAQERKPQGQGHTANKTPWDLRSDNRDQNPDFTCVLLVGT